MPAVVLLQPGEVQQDVGRLRRRLDIPALANAHELFAGPRRIGGVLEDMRAIDEVELLVGKRRALDGAVGEWAVIALERPRAMRGVAFVEVCEMGSVGKGIVPRADVEHFPAGMDVESIVRA